MGIVYEAAETGPVRRHVALKVVRAALRSDDVRSRFDAERQALALMDHPGIATVFQAGETAEGDPYFAMELVKGLSIDDFCDSRKLSTEARLELFIGVCEAVQHAHQKGVIHRDLKPSNILVTELDGRPQPKIIDFGIAKALGLHLTEKTFVTEAGAPIGTMAYMSPEQAESSGIDVDTRTDIYSLGVILYLLLVGRLPVEPTELGIHAFFYKLASGDSQVPRPSARFTGLGEFMGSLAEVRRTDPERLRRELSGDLDWIVMRCLEKDRKQRYHDIADVRLDLVVPCHWYGPFSLRFSCWCGRWYDLLERRVKLAEIVPGIVVRSVPTAEATSRRSPVVRLTNEVLLRGGELLDRRRVEIPGDHHRRVVRCVVGPEEVFHIVE